MASLPVACVALVGVAGFSFHDQRVQRLVSSAPRRLRSTLSKEHEIPRAPHGNAGLRVAPWQFGADPHGQNDSSDALQMSVDYCVNQSLMNRGVFPGLEDDWGPVRDAGGCIVDLDGGEYLISKPIRFPEFVANMEFGYGSIVADSKMFPAGAFLLVVGVNGSCQFPQGSCNMDLNFPDVFLDGSNVASGMQINNVMGTTVGPGGYFLNFTTYGLQINNGHEVMMERCWLGETNFDYKFAKHKTLPRATAIQINGNDHYILNTIIFSSKVGVQVNGAADVIKGVHVWFPLNQALAFNDTMAFHVPSSGNRFDGCYIDGGRAVFEGDGLQQNLWTNGFECCAGRGLEQVPHGIILRGNTIGPGLQIFGNMFNGGSITHETASAGKHPVVLDSRISHNSFSDTGRHTQVSQSLTQEHATWWKFDFCDQLVFPVIASVHVSLQVPDGFPSYAVRPTDTCKVLVETDTAVSGTMNVQIDSSSHISSQSKVSVVI